MKKSAPFRARGPFLTLILAALLPTGCAGWTYDHIRLGQPLREFRRAIPESRSRQTEHSVCYLRRDYLGRTDAVVVVLTPDQQAAAKFQATDYQRNWGVGVQRGFLLRGVVDPQLGGFIGSGPVDMLRAIADELTRSSVDAMSRETHNWVTAGILRLIQHWPHEGDEGPALKRMTYALECVPEGGESSIDVDADGVYHFEYCQGRRF